jgi:hypothetical protein
MSVESQAITERRSFRSFWRVMHVFLLWPAGAISRVWVQCSLPGT